MSKIVFVIRFIVKINLIKTILINFRCLPFKEACHFPILIFGPCKLHHLCGKIEFTSHIKFGQLLIGISDPFRSCFDKTYISLLGKMIVGEHVVLRRGMKLIVSGVLTVGDSVHIGDNNDWTCSESVTIGNFCRFANNVTIMDTDFHYVLNTETRQIKQNHAPVVIGENNWIGAWTTIKKGTRTPKGTIVAGPYSTIGKDFIGKIPENSFLAGSPVKLVRSGCRRVNCKESDAIIRDHFDGSNDNYILPDDIDLDAFCEPQMVNGIIDEL